MRRREFLECAAGSLAPGIGPGDSVWLFRTYPGRLKEAGPERERWRRLYPGAHVWFEAIAAGNLPLTAVLARAKVSKELPLAAEIFRGSVRHLDGCRILEWCSFPGQRDTLTGFANLTARWESATRFQSAPARLAVFKVEAR